MFDQITSPETLKQGRPSLNGFSPDEIKGQMERMLASKLFKGSRRLSRFLRFTVEQTLMGERDRLKEYCIGLEVFEKPESFDPRMDSIVRVMARRLRILVNSYYQTDGRDDTLEIHFDSGSYVPSFRARTPGEDQASSSEPELLVFRADSDVIREVAACLTMAGAMRPDVLDGAVAQLSGGLGGGLASYDASTPTPDAGLLAFYVAAPYREQIVDALALVGGEVVATRHIQPDELQSALRSVISRRKAESAVSV